MMFSRTNIYPRSILVDNLQRVRLLRAFSISFNFHDSLLNPGLLYTLTWIGFCLDSLQRDRAIALHQCHNHHPRTTLSNRHHRTSEVTVLAVRIQVYYILIDSERFWGRRSLCVTMLSEGKAIALCQSAQ